MGDEGQVPSKDRMKEEGHKCIVLDAMQSMETGRRPVDAAASQWSPASMTLDDG